MATYEKSPFTVNLEAKWRFQLPRDCEGIIPTAGRERFERRR